MSDQTALVRQQCDMCGSFRFAVFYDPDAQGSHVECARCGEIVRVNG